MSTSLPASDPLLEGSSPQGRTTGSPSPTSERFSRQVRRAWRRRRLLRDLRKEFLRVE